ncbi:hypothetical protein L210DRAFT_3642925 [Boletus edulis BED1]|uniref:Uncharacterized protein n=1 Tax=Boletus edulis BED1 TaxID=1328754 RepID=A0AAD4GHK3_BOLED|nr:hypothetical protein L210DRAFT_3642925 [Boletus edulis BED1]
MPSIQARMVEERWTPTTIQTAFVLPESELRKVSIDINSSINLPFPKTLGWTFALSVKRLKNLGRSSTYYPMAFSFRRHDSAIPWGRTSICAQLSLAVKQPQSTDPEHDYHPATSVDAAEEPLGTIELVLADTPSVQVPITTRRKVSIRPPNKVCLTVTVSDCALPDGFFQARSSPISEGGTQAHLVRQGCDHLSSRSLATGKPFDVKFLTPSTRSTSGKTGDPLPTYASLSVVEEHVDLSFSVLREGWMNALAPPDDTGTKCLREISCSDEYDHELDSDFEDEDEAPPCNSSSERDLAAREDQQSDGGTERSSSSFSSFDLEKASDQGSVDHQLEEIINAMHLKESSSNADCERTVEIKFAAHRTWHAFLWYCYTGTLEFSKLRSQVGPGGLHLHVTPLEGGPPACSPKSMYRLADLVGDKDLKAKALAAIKERMIEENVLSEAFSVFTSKYPEVRQVQLGVLKEHRRSPKVKQAFLGAMEKYGNMPHAKPVLSTFYDDFVAWNYECPVLASR